MELPINVADFPDLQALPEDLRKPLARMFGNPDQHKLNLRVADCEVSVYVRIKPNSKKMGTCLGCRKGKRKPKTGVLFEVSIEEIQSQQDGKVRLKSPLGKKVEAAVHEIVWIHGQVACWDCYLMFMDSISPERQLSVEWNAVSVFS